MNFTVIDVEQGSPEWHAARVAKLTGSRAPDMMATIKSGAWSASRRNLCVGMALERMTGKPYERSFSSRVTTQGKEGEPLLLSTYEAKSGNIVERTGFLSVDGMPIGCSLDGSVNNFEGIVEGKFPESATHRDYLKSQQIPEIYRYQCIHNMWVSNARWCDFVSFDPSWPEHMQYMCIRMERNEQEIATYAAAVTRFLAEVTVEYNELVALGETLRARKEAA
jgi:predicted phage-related endonuclease